MEGLAMYLKAFIVGGLFFVVGQVLIDYTKLTPARILTSYVVAGVILSGHWPLISPWRDCCEPEPAFHSPVLAIIWPRASREAVAKDGLLGAFTGGIYCRLSRSVCSCIFRSFDFSHI